MHKQNFIHRGNSAKAQLRYHADNNFGAFAPRFKGGKRITPELVNQWYKEASEKGRNKNEQ